MRALRCVIVASFLGAACLMAQVAAAEESGWKMPNLNPFQSQDKPARKRPAPPSRNDSSLLKLPQLPTPALPSWGRKDTPSKRSVRSNQPSSVDRMTKSTTDFFAKSYDALTPWDNGPKKPATRQMSRKKSTKAPAWPDWLAKDKSTKARSTTTPSDFLRLPRVKP